MSQAEHTVSARAAVPPNPARAPEATKANAPARYKDVTSFLIALPSYRYLGRLPPVTFVPVSLAQRAFQLGLYSPGHSTAYRLRSRPGSTSGRPSARRR